MLALWKPECWEKSSEFFKRIVSKPDRLPGGIDKDHLRYFAKPDAQALIVN